MPLLQGRGRMPLLQGRGKDAPPTGTRQGCLSYYGGNLGYCIRMDSLIQAKNLTLNALD